MSGMNHKNPTIVWAVDPYEKTIKYDLRAMRLVASEGLIFPVYVANTTPSDVQRELRTDEEFFQITLDKRLKNIELTSTQAPEVIYCGVKEDPAERLLRFAESKGANAIALMSHGRSGLDRLAFGSFAENLLQKSPVPILFLSDARKESHALDFSKKVVFFPTDFSEAAKKAFQEFLPLARKMGCSISLYHSIVSPSSVAMGEGIYVPEDYFLTQKRDSMGRASEWINLAKNFNVSVNFEVEENSIGYVRSEEILRAAQNGGACMIVLPSTSSKLSQALLGSVAFDVFRASKYPVLVYGRAALESQTNDVVPGLSFQKVQESAL